MTKQLLPAISFIILLSSCSALKPLNFTSSKQVMSSPAPATHAKFIDNIAVTAQNGTASPEERPDPKETVDAWAISTKKNTSKETPMVKGPKQEDTRQNDDILASRRTEVENASSVQLKYSVLLNTEVESLPNKSLLEAVDEWYGVRYRTGGNDKNGVDCSGFSVAVYAAVFGYTLPRVSREQYRTSRHISETELQEGDLVFFDTKGIGNVTHVGVYLGNNKFIHASVSRGVMVSDLFDPYYSRRFFGAGRIDEKQFVAAN